MESVANNLLLLLANISQLKNSERVKTLFAEGLTNIFAPDEVKWRDAVEEKPGFFEVCTKNATHGAIEFKTAEFTPQTRALIQNAAQMVGVILENISHQNTKKRDLALEKEKYQLLFKNSPVGVLIYNRHGQILDANHKLIEILGSPGMEATMKINLFELPAMLKAGISDDLKRGIETGDTISDVKNYESVWGVKLTLRYTITPLFFYEQKPTVAQVIVEDFTEYIKTQNEILAAKNRAEENEKKVKSLLNAIPDLIFVFDKYGVIRDYSASNNDLYVAPEKFINKKIDEVLPGSIAVLTRQKILATLQDLAVQEYEYSLDLKGEKRFYDARMVPLAEDKTLAIVRDMTAMKTAQQQLVAAKERAEQSDKLKSAFLANLSHEIRTPLNGIVGFAQMLKKDCLSKDKLEKYVGIISNQSTQLLHIISDIVDIAKLEAGQVMTYVETIDLDDLVEELISIYSRKQDNANIIFKSVTPDNNYQLYSDRTKVHQILSNLLSNAYKYTYTGEIQLGYKVTAEEIIFYVADTGIGIDPAYHEKIFERFRRLDPGHKNRGTGLGLSICEGFAQLLGGYITLESEPGKGSCFYFHHPKTSRDKTAKTPD